MYTAYVLYSKGFDRYYVGMTKRLGPRIKEHNFGKMSSTKAFVPWILVHSEGYGTRIGARQREIYLKTAAGRRWRKEHIRPRGATEYPPARTGLGQE